MKKPKILISVRSSEEIKLINNLAVDIVDMKEPKNGPFGMVNIETSHDILSSLRNNHFCGEVSTTFEPFKKEGEKLDNQLFIEYCRLNVGFLKVGFCFKEDCIANVKEFLSSSQYIQSPKLILVLMINNQFNRDFVKTLLSSITGKFFGLMFDTYDKSKGSIFDILDIKDILWIKHIIEKKNLIFGIAGSLNKSHSSLIKKVDPYWVGFRGGVCKGSRSMTISRRKVKELIWSLRV